MKFASDEQLEEYVRSEMRAAVNGIAPVFHIGITGSRESPHIPQKTRLAVMLYRTASRYAGTIRIHHGCCQGTDEQAHSVACSIDSMEIYGYPGQDAKGRSPYRMESTEGFTKLFPPTLYSERNKTIVNACMVLFACPQYPEDHPRSLRSGTWQTIRYARRVRKPIVYILPNGSIYI